MGRNVNYFSVPQYFILYSNYIITMCGQLCSITNTFWDKSEIATHESGIGLTHFMLYVVILIINSPGCYVSRVSCCVTHCYMLSDYLVNCCVSGVSCWHDSHNTHNRQNTQTKISRSKEKIAHSNLTRQKSFYNTTKHKIKYYQIHIIYKYNSIVLYFQTHKALPYTL